MTRRALRSASPSTQRPGAPVRIPTMPSVEKGFTRSRGNVGAGERGLAAGTTPTCSPSGHIAHPDNVFKSSAPPFYSKTQRDSLQVSPFGFGGHRSVTRKSMSSSSGPSAGEGKRQKLLHTTGSGKVVVARSEKNSLRFHLCIQALSEGCIQTYMHLFYLLHRDPVCVDELSQTYFVIPDDKLKWVQEELSAVEVLRRQSEFTEVCERCKKLADYFESERDYNEAMWNYEASLRYAMESLDRNIELQVRGDFAAFYERRGSYGDAADLYESMYRLAMALDYKERVKDICLCLVRVYQALGDSVAGVDPHAAKRFYEKSVKVAQQSKAGKEEGMAYSALGEVNEHIGMLDKALYYQRSFQFVSKRENQQKELCQAVLKVASLEDRMGQSAAATETLLHALELAKELGDPVGICRATMQLGEAYKTNGAEDKAMQCFKDSFEAACASGQADLIESSRIAMGFVLGEYYIKHAGGGRGYLEIACHDIRSQLDWMSKGVL